MNEYSKKFIKLTYKKVTQEMLNEIFCKMNTEGEFYECDFRGCDFSKMKLRNFNFCRCNFEGCNFYKADLLGASIHHSNFANTNFNFAIVSYVDFFGSDFSNSDLRNTNFFGAELSCTTNLDTVKKNSNTHFIGELHCPEEGEFTAFFRSRDNKLIKYLIPEDAIRISSTTKLCGCDKAKILDITSIDGNIHYSDVRIDDKQDVIHKVGDIVKTSDFKEGLQIKGTQIAHNSADGIRFFVSKEDAINL